MQMQLQVDGNFCVVLLLYWTNIIIDHLMINLLWNCEGVFLKFDFKQITHLIVGCCYS